MSPSTSSERTFDIFGAPAVPKYSGSGAVPKQPVDHCFWCRAGEHETCDKMEMKLCRCHQVNHATGRTDV